MLLTAVLIVAGTLRELHLRTASRLSQVVAAANQALAGTHAAIEAGDLSLASQRVAEAQAGLRADRVTLHELATESDRVQEEVKARQTDEARLKRFLELANRAQHQMATGGNMVGREQAEDALAEYGVLTADDWLNRLDGSYLTAELKQQVRETAYSTLVSLADFSVRWSAGSDALQRCAELLRRASAFHASTRAFYFVRSQYYKLQGSIVEAEKDITRFKATEALTAWDYFLPGHTAGWDGDLEEAMRSYKKALRIQPDHYDSLFFLACRMADHTINRLPEAIAYFTACIALRPESITSYFNRADCHERLGHLDEAEVDYSAAIVAAASESARATAYQQRYRFYTVHGLTAKACDDRDKAFALCKHVLASRAATHGPTDPDTLNAMSNLAHAYEDSEQLNQAILLREQILAIQTQNRGSDHPDIWAAMESLAQLYQRAGKADQAVPLGEQLFAAYRVKFGTDNWRTLMAGRQLASFYGLAEILDKELSLAEQLVAACRAKLVSDDKVTMSCMEALAAAYGRNGKLDQSLALFEAVLAGFKVEFGSDHTYTLGVMVAFAGALLQAGKLEDAERLLRQRLAISATVSAPNLGVETAAGLAFLSRICLLQGRYTEAEKHARESLAFYQERRPDDRAQFNAMSLVGDVLRGQGQFAAAEPLLLRGYEGLKQREGKPAWAYPEFQAFPCRGDRASGAVVRSLGQARTGGPMAARATPSRRTRHPSRTPNPRLSPSETRRRS